MDRYLSRRRLIGATVSLAAATTLSRRRGALAAPRSAQNLPNFEGVDLSAALIGGGSYELLYTRLDEWSQATGATIDTSTRLAHGELNDKLRQEYASGSPTPRHDIRALPHFG